MSELSSDTNIILKLDLGDKGGVRRIRLNRLWQEDEVSYERLQQLACSFYANDNENNGGNMVMKYEDEDGDTITISSNEELSDAFLQFKNKVPPVLRATATFINNTTNNSTNANTNTNTNTNTNNIAEQPSAILKVMDTFNEALANAIDNFQKRIPKDAPPKDAIDMSTPSVPIVERTLQEEEVCQEEQEAERMAEEVIANLKASTPTIKVVQEEKKKIEDEKLQEKKPTVIASIPSHYDVNFIHGRHTCDGCLVTPIFGIRYHAKNLPDYDLCQLCVKKTRDKHNITFKPIQHDRDVHLQYRWKRRQQRLARQSGHCRSYHQQTKANTNEDDTDFNEAIRQSLLPSKEEHTTVQMDDAKSSMPPKIVTNKESDIATTVKSDISIINEPEIATSVKSEISTTKEPEIATSVESDTSDSVKSEISDKDLYIAFKLISKIEEKGKQEIAASLEPVLVEKEELKIAASFEPVIVEKEELNFFANLDPMIVDHEKLEIAASLEPEILMSDSVDMEELKIAHTSIQSEIVNGQELNLGPDTKSWYEGNVRNEEEYNRTNETSFASDAEGKGDVAVAIGKTLDKCAEEIDAIVSEITKADMMSITSFDESLSKEVVNPRILDSVPSQSQDDIDVTSEAGRTILDSVPDKEENDFPNRTEEDWQVLDDSQQIQDEMIARAAQLLGSALFSSDLIQSTEELTGNPSEDTFLTAGDSVVSTVPSNISSISSDVLHRWDKEFFKLHELGFLDDHRNLDTLERLEEANINAGSTEPVTISQVVNELVSKEFS
eukprot:CAMPEP_0197827940 /NCGR_PEP_ID=MMETSP1437-20131217/4607_1 /TAXON_ID=49252 ORGANISM="Eucampia antarctica, Strain CCMP1452" /NCGR_SAMPLE_ID=MMETSP1437 /ASSEMBLY_ACC=CAM_ASM_001096 /LENGTH=780 /DNA_ID=CAMNT_0043428973 /DNA_START=233 /DNA_END=2575 /DNA_ORIENTATION=+